jgi:hypothetical protein
MLKWIGKIAAGAFIFLFLILSLIPTLLSTGFGKDFVLNQINKKIPGAFFAKEVSLSWLGKQKIENWELTDKNQVPIASIRSIESDKSLLSWLFTFHHPAHLRLTGLNTQIVADNQGVTNIEDALGIKKQASRESHPPVYLENTNIEIKEDSKHHLTLKAVGLTRQDIKGQFAIDAHLGEQKSLKLRLEHFPTLFLDQLLSIRSPELSGLILKLAGDYIDVSSSQVLKGAKHQLQIVASSPFIHAKLQGQISENTLLLDSGSLIQFEIPQENTHLLSQILWQNDLSVSRPLKGEIFVDSLNIPLQKGPELFNGKIVASIGPNRFYSTPGSTPLEFSSVKISIDAPNSSKDLALLIEAEGTSSVDLEFNVPKKALFSSKFDSLYQQGASLKGSMQGNLKSLPSFVAANFPAPLATILGPDYSLEFSGNLKENDSEIHFGLDSSRSSFEFSMAIPHIPFKELFRGKQITSSIEGIATIKQPRIKNFSDFLSSIDEVTIPWRIDPETNALKVSFIGTKEISGTELFSGSLWADQFHLEGNPDFSDCPLELRLVLNDFQTKTLNTLFPDYPLKPALGDKFNAQVVASRDINGDINGCFDLQCPKEKDSEAFLKKLTSKFTLQNDNRDITFETNSSQLVGSTQFTGTLHQLFDEKGALSLDSAFISVKGNLKHFPVKLMTHLATGDLNFADKMEAVMGTAVDADIFAKIRDKNGPLQLDLKGHNGTLHLDGRIENGILLLNAPLIATLKVTPQLESAVISEMLPLLGSVISSEKPIELTIPKEGFALPLHPLSITQLKIARAELMLNKMEFSQDSPIGKAADLLGVHSKTIEVWLTPAYFSLNRGILDLSRTDMLIGGAYPIASWGTVNFNEDNLHLIIGLSGQALKKAFSISGINNNYMLQIPLQGPIKKPQLDLAKAAPRLSALIGMSQGGPEGKILGTFFDVASDIITNEKTPLSTTNPLPWEGTLEETTDDGGESDLPFQDIKKGAKKLLKNIFGK